VWPLSWACRYAIGLKIVGAEETQPSAVAWVRGLAFVGPYDRFPRLGAQSGLTLVGPYCFLSLW